MKNILSIAMRLLGVVILAILAFHLLRPLFYLISSEGAYTYTYSAKLVDGKFFNEGLLIVAVGLGFALKPFTTLGCFASIISFVGIPVGLAYFGFTLWVEHFGKGVWALVGLFAGLYLGGKFVSSGLFDKVMHPVRVMMSYDKPSGESDTAD
jgi:hypothetical protein